MLIYFRQFPNTQTVAYLSRNYKVHANRNIKF